MSILVITVYAGSAKLVAMTERMLEELEDSIVRFENQDYDETVDVIAVNNGAVRAVDKEALYFDHITHEKNIGFGKAVNHAIKTKLRVEHTDVLVLNNDLEFPDPNWLTRLLTERESFYVCSPTTDLTATKEAQAKGPVSDKPAKRVAQVSAFCWLVPRRVINALRTRFGFQLFDPEFFAYGEDDYTGAVLRKIYGGTPFKVVRRSWVRHLKGQTGAEMHLSGGMKRNLDLLKRKMRANKLR